MIVRFLIKDHKGSCREVNETHQTTESVVDRIFELLSDSSSVSSIGVSKCLSGDCRGPVRFWGWFTIRDSYAYIYANLKDL